MLLYFSLFLFLFNSESSSTWKPSLVNDYCFDFGTFSIHVFKSVESQERGREREEEKIIVSFLRFFDTKQVLDKTFFYSLLLSLSLSLSLSSSHLYTNYGSSL